MDEDFCYWREARQFNPFHAENVRRKFMLNDLDTDQKMELYNCAYSGNLEKFKELIEKKKYPILEEISASGYFWTALHYACHYGNANIVEYIMETYHEDEGKTYIMNMQTNLGLTPLFIAVNGLGTLENKKKIVVMYAKNKAIDYKICTKEGEDIYDLVKKIDTDDDLMGVLKKRR